MLLVNDAFKICKNYGFPLTAQGMADCSFLLTEALESGVFFHEPDYSIAIQEALTLSRAALKLLETQNA